MPESKYPRKLIHQTKHLNFFENALGEKWATLKSYPRGVSKDECRYQAWLEVEQTEWCDIYAQSLKKAYRKDVEQGIGRRLSEKELENLMYNGMMFDLPRSLSLVLTGLCEPL